MKYLSWFGGSIDTCAQSTHALVPFVSRVCGSLRVKTFFRGDSPNPSGCRENGGRARSFICLLGSMSWTQRRHFILLAFSAILREKRSHPMGEMLQEIKINYNCIIKPCFLSFSTRCFLLLGLGNLSNFDRSERCQK